MKKKGSYFSSAEKTHQQHDIDGLEEPIYLF
jgi:hypothetical protein